MSRYFVKKKNCNSKIYNKCLKIKLSEMVKIDQLYSWRLDYFIIIIFCLYHDAI